MGKPGRPGGMVQMAVVATPALLEASGPLRIREAAAALGITGAQIYRWLNRYDLCRGPSVGRGHAITVDAAALREWIVAARPLVWVHEPNDGLGCDGAEYDRRLAACRRMLARWGGQDEVKQEAESGLHGRVSRRCT